MTDKTPATDANSPVRSVQRLRHPLKARLLEVRQVRQLSPHFISVTLAGEALEGFVSASFDDHLKLILPAPGASEPVMPDFGAEGTPRDPNAPRPTMRDYTPRRYDAAAGELEIELALHGDGPAADWAAQARPGQKIGIGGPRGSFVVPLDYGWHLLIGDETALPAIARRLEELPAGSRAIVVVQLDDAADRRSLSSQAALELHWVDGAGGTAALVAAVEQLQLPAGEGYAWAAGESQAMAAVRKVLVGRHGLDKDHVRASAYWKRGASAHHENLADAPENQAKTA